MRHLAVVRTAEEPGGECWLWCRRPRVPVEPLGMAEAAGQVAEVTACAECTVRLRDWARPGYAPPLPAWLSVSLPRSPDRVLGECWLYCGRAGVPVQWLGSVVCGPVVTPVLACAECAAVVLQLIEAHHI